MSESSLHLPYSSSKNASIQIIKDTLYLPPGVEWTMKEKPIEVDLKDITNIVKRAAWKASTKWIISIRKELRSIAIEAAEIDFWFHSNVKRNKHSGHALLPFLVH